MAPVRKRVPRLQLRALVPHELHCASSSGRRAAQLRTETHSRFLKQMRQQKHRQRRLARPAPTVPLDPDEGQKGLRYLHVFLQEAVLRVDAYFHCFKSDADLREMLKRYSSRRLEPAALRCVVVDESKPRLKTTGSARAAWRAKGEVLDEFRTKAIGGLVASRLLS